MANKNKRMKMWIKDAIIGAIIGLVIGLINYLVISKTLTLIIVKIITPLAFLYKPFADIFNITYSASLFSIFALLIEGFILGAIIGLIIQKINHKK